MGLYGRRRRALFLYMRMRFTGAHQTQIRMKILLVTLPFVQLNTPYPATTELKAYLASKGHEVTQCDLSIETAEKIFLARVSRSGVPRGVRARQAVVRRTMRGLAERALLRHRGCGRGFLRGDDDTMAPLIASPDYLPHGRRFAKQDEDTLEWAFGTCGLSDRARHMATLYIEDLSDFIAEIVSPDFAGALRRTTGYFRSIVRRHIRAHKRRTQRHRPPYVRYIQREDGDHSPRHGVGFSVPFPGTHIGAHALRHGGKRELRSHTRDGRRICQHRAEKPLGRTNILTS